ncbi:MAG: hypothetical protein EA341_18350 [Mongoliibacter sp.]|uniref:hypothetical protein n=1 Tax=Mongoliibacter sp. TaxID=2022438 RepID=UPI0012EFC0EB|nr:hypothetical protein [Mongoliibacter sp.]TVP43268.1 MAG: hypothetical protein EA341_18350 [Mongoliibacter sp.]
MWGQFIFTERMKLNASRSINRENYFWRTYDGQGFDLIELDSSQNLQALECKLGNGKAKIPVAFEKAYPNANWNKVDNSNFLDWVL